MTYIIVDIDETICNWIGGFKKYYYQKTGIKLKGRPDQYSMINWVGVPRADLRKLIIDYNETSEFFGDLEPMFNSEIYLPKLKNEGYKFVAISSCSDSPFTIEQRNKNLDKIFGLGFFENVFITGIDKSKEPYLQKFSPTWFVEDKITNARMGKNLGHNSIVIMQSPSYGHMSNNPDLIWVHGWKEIYEIIHNI